MDKHVRGRKSFGLKWASHTTTRKSGLFTCTQCMKSGFLVPVPVDSFLVVVVVVEEMERQGFLTD